MWWNKKPTDCAENTPPRVIEITSEGRRIVDPLSIIMSPEAGRHLEFLASRRISPLDPTRGGREE